MTRFHICRVLGLAVALSPGMAVAEWRAMSGPEMARALTDVTLTYGSGQQIFYASGRTLYDSGRPSWGYWELRGDQYCSQWPPADGWACYDMERDEGTARLRFIGQSGDVTEADLAE